MIAAAVGLTAFLLASRPEAPAPPEAVSNSTASSEVADEVSPDAAYLSTIHRLLPAESAQLDDAAIVADGHSLCASLQSGGGNFGVILVRMGEQGVPDEVALLVMRAAARLRA